MPAVTAAGKCSLMSSQVSDIEINRQRALTFSWLCVSRHLSIRPIDGLPIRIAGRSETQ
jgi:hypothetical protein